MILGVVSVFYIVLDILGGGYKGGISWLLDVFDFLVFLYFERIYIVYIIFCIRLDN